MTGRKRLFKLDDVRVSDPQGRRITGRTPWERHVPTAARRMRAAGETVGQVGPMPLTAAPDLEQLGEVAAHPHGCWPDQHAPPGGDPDAPGDLERLP